VVRAAAEVHGDATVERVAGGGERARDGAPAAVDELRRPGQAQRALLARRQAALADAREQAAVVDLCELGPADGVRLVQLSWRREAVRDDALGQQRVLLEREAMVLRQREPRAVMGPELHLDRFNCPSWPSLLLRATAPSCSRRWSGG
jgi:hypothetical protein